MFKTPTAKLHVKVAGVPHSCRAHQDCVLYGFCQCKRPHFAEDTMIHARELNRMEYVDNTHHISFQSRSLRFTILHWLRYAFSSAYRFECNGWVRLGSPAPVKYAFYPPPMPTPGTVHRLRYIDDVGPIS